jgi:hypothetical protein
MDIKIAFGVFIVIILITTSLKYIMLKKFFKSASDHVKILGDYYDHTGEKTMSITKLSSKQLKIMIVGEGGPPLIVNKQKLESGDPYLIPSTDSAPKDTPPEMLEYYKNMYFIIKYNAKTCSMMGGIYDKSNVALSDVVYNLKASKKVCN